MINKKALAVLKRYINKKDDSLKNNIIKNGVYCNGFLIVRSSYIEDIIIDEKKGYELQDINVLRAYEFKTLRSFTLEKNILNKILEFAKTVQDFQLEFSKDKIKMINDYSCFEGGNKLIDINLSLDGKNFRNMLEYAYEEFNGELELHEVEVNKNGVFFCNALKISCGMKNFIML